MFVTLDRQGHFRNDSKRTKHKRKILHIILYQNLKLLLTMKLASFQREYKGNEVIPVIP